MNCEEAKILSIAHILGDLDPGSEQCRQFESHLAFCQVCAEEYKSSKWAIRFIEEHKAEFAVAFEAIDREKAAEQEEIERSWKRIEARLDELDVQKRKEKQAKFHRLVVRVSAVAACFVVGISTFLTYSIYSKQKIVPKPTTQQVAHTIKPSVRIELVSKNGRILIPANQRIASTDELKMLVINGRHRMMMNTNTILAVESLIENNNTGCLVKLASGRIYTHVEHDGNPFVVDTAHGNAVITGTTFDVKVTDDNTTLVVSEGTVQFESENGVVNVAAGQTSKIAGQSAPSIPLSCNTAKLTAWATGYKPELALVEVKSNTDPWELTLSLGKEPVVLEETDYTTWVEQKRGWFKQNFPWIFQLKDALAKEGIKVDYPMLLIETGDVWQFVYLDVSPARFSVIDSNSLIKITSDYGFDKQWLLENVPTTKSALENSVLSENSFTGLKAFERWLEYAGGKKEPPTSIYSYHASKYLTETRSLIWFAVRDCQYDLTDEERTEVLALLQEEVTAACKCQNGDLYPQEEAKSPCDDICQEQADRVVAYIETMKLVEERIAVYEIAK